MEELEPAVDFDTAKYLFPGKVLGRHIKIALVDLHIGNQQGNSAVENPDRGQDNPCYGLRVEASRELRVR